MMTINPTRTILFALLSNLVLLAPLAAAAEQAEAPQTDPPTAAQDGDGATDAAAEPAPEDGDGDVEGSEVFIPTEEISEDFAVSFPVDI